MPKVFGGNPRLWNAGSRAMIGKGCGLGLGKGCIWPRLTRLGGIFLSSRQEKGLRRDS